MKGEGSIIISKDNFVTGKNSSIWGKDSIIVSYDSITRGKDSTVFLGKMMR